MYGAQSFPAVFQGKFTPSAAGDQTGLSVKAGLEAEAMQVLSQITMMTVTDSILIKFCMILTQKK